MAKCARCGVETELYDLGVPICPACITGRDGVVPSVDSLRAEVTSAKELYHKAMEEFEHRQALCRSLPNNHPDRTIAARSEAEAKKAGERYWEALRAYGEAVRRDSG